jgi:hypothetical protein
MPSGPASATVLLSYAKERDVDDGLGAGFWFKILGLAVAFAVGGILLFSLLGAAWARYGALGTLLLFSALALAYGYIYDRRQAKRYRDLEA